MATESLSTDDNAERIAAKSDAIASTTTAAEQNNDNSQQQSTTTPSEPNKASLSTQAVHIDAPPSRSVSTSNATMSSSGATEQPRPQRTVSQAGIRAAASAIANDTSLRTLLSDAGAEPTTAPSLASVDVDQLEPGQAAILLRAAARDLRSDSREDDALIRAQKRISERR